LENGLLVGKATYRAYFLEGGKYRINRSLELGSFAQSTTSILLGTAWEEVGHRNHPSVNG
jgi:hypothetical protein